MAEFLFGPSFDGLTRALTLYQRRHEVLASNIANVETPGYRAKELDFQGALKAAFDQEREKDLALPDPKVVDDPNAPSRADGSTVDVDLQMTKLAGNGTSYLALSRILAKKLAGLRSAIEGVR